MNTIISYLMYSARSLIVFVNHEANIHPYHFMKCTVKKIYPLYFSQLSLWQSPFHNDQVSKRLTSDLMSKME